MVSPKRGILRRGTVPSNGRGIVAHSYLGACMSMQGLCMVRTVQGNTLAVGAQTPYVVLQGNAYAMVYLLPAWATARPLPAVANRGNESGEGSQPRGRPHAPVRLVPGATCKALNPIPVPKKQGLPSPPPA